jgi:hypothetical protein
MDPEGACDYADQGPLPDRDMEADSRNDETLLKHMPSSMKVEDIERYCKKFQCNFLLQ